MAKNKKQSNKESSKVSFLGCDNVETAREIIESDKNTARKKAFLEAYEKTKLIVPNYSINSKKPKNASSSSGGRTFSQNIIVTPEKVEIETMENEQKQPEEEKEREE